MKVAGAVLLVVCLLILVETNAKSRKKYKVKIKIKDKSKRDDGDLLTKELPQAALVENTKQELQRDVGDQWAEIRNEPSQDFTDENREVVN